MGMTSATLHRWDDLPRERVTDSLARRIITGDRMTLAHLRLDRGARVPVHSHENEQLSWVLEGALRFVVEEAESSEGGDSGEVVVVRSGEVLHLPSGLPHGAEALEDTIAVDIFSPPRADWVDGTDGYLRGGDS